MSLDDTNWVEEFIAGLESVGIKLSEEKKEQMKAEGVERMKKSFKGEDNDE